MRTQGILLVRDAILLLSILPANGKRYASISLISSGWNFNFISSGRHQIRALAAVMRSYFSLARGVFSAAARQYKKIP